MLAEAGPKIGIQVTTLDPVAHSPASQVAPAIAAAYDDETALADLAARADVLTYEFENVSAEALRNIEDRVTVLPCIEALRISQDRVAEKDLFVKVGLPTADYARVDSLPEIAEAAALMGLPAVLKSRRLGYDGKGQAVIARPGEIESAWNAIGRRAAILEPVVAFDRELSIVAVRSRDGQVAAYPLVENLHVGGILRRSRAPARRFAAKIQDIAEAYARAMLFELDYVGVMAVELFQVGDELLANEFAPRVHNSGHWTIEGTETSQFENHLRAICGLPLGSTAPTGQCVMFNLIGEVPDLAALEDIPEAHVHQYGKEPRPGRKLGHVTVVAENRESLKRLALQVEAIVDDASVRDLSDLP
jgi:5-(carboxyamino)imidazole ribonucleotide synthase